MPANTKMVVKIVKKFSHAVAAFVATKPDALATLPRDPSGLLARTVPLKPGQGDSMSDADYDPAGAMQLEDNPIQAGPAMQDAGVDTVAISQTTVYQARDAEAAQAYDAAIDATANEAERAFLVRRRREIVGD